MKNETVYISGPMTGYPEFNYPAFNSAAKSIRDLGYEVLNPAENFEGNRDRTREEYMRLDFRHVLKANRVVVLPGHEKSSGSIAEVLMAQQMGLPICKLVGTDKPHPRNTGPSIKYSLEEVNVKVSVEAESAFAEFCGETAKAAKPDESICHEADRIVSLDRQDTYGHPSTDFRKTAEAMNGLGFRVEDYEDGAIRHLTSRDIPIFMICIKLSRLMKGYKRDSAVDIAGYAKTLDLIVQRESPSRPCDLG